jgi:hypothetical protein
VFVGFRSGGQPTDFSFADVAEKLAELHGNLFVCVRRPLFVAWVLLADLLQAEICAKCGMKYYRDYEVTKKDSDEAEDEDESEDDEDSHLTGRSWYHFLERRRRRTNLLPSCQPDGSSTTPVTRKAAMARCETRSSILVRALKKTSLPRRSPNPRKPT